MSHDHPEHTRWHHRPHHLFVPNQTYMVTASTLHKKAIFHGPQRLALLTRTLLSVARDLGWTLDAWAVFENHYHFVGTSPQDPGSLKRLVQTLHRTTATEANRLDGTPFRQVWFEFWDTCVTYEASYFARLHYVHDNPVKHGLVQQAQDDLFCSAREFMVQEDRAFVRRVLSYRYEKVKVPGEV